MKMSQNQNFYGTAANFNLMAIGGDSGAAMLSSNGVVVTIPAERPGNVNSASGFYSYAVVPYVPPRSTNPVTASTDSEAVTVNFGDGNSNVHSFVSPSTFLGTTPGNCCELFVKGIPKHLNEAKFVQPFQRFGTIYEVRLPMDFSQVNRGYAHVRFFHEIDALCCKEVLDHFFVDVKTKLEIFRSQDKRRLFVNNIPNELSDVEIERELRIVFPRVKNVIIRKFRENVQDAPNGAGDGDGKGPSPLLNGCAIDGDNESSVGEFVTTQIFRKTAPNRLEPIYKNRGYAFVEFASHQDANIAKHTQDGRLLRLWGREQNVCWAKREISDNEAELKTLFVRNVAISVTSRELTELFSKHLPRDSVHKIKKLFSTAFVEFVSHEAAQKCLHKLNGVQLRGRRLELEYAKPKDQQVHNSDYDAVLRLKCLANNWHVPIILFGTYFKEPGIQNVLIILRSSDNMVRAIFCIMHTDGLTDVHGRACEVVCSVIDIIGGFPDFNYAFIVENDTAHLVGVVNHNMQNIAFVAVNGVPSHFALDFNEIVDLSSAAATLAGLNESYVIKLYNESFSASTIYTYLKDVLVCGYRVFGTILPRYRNKPPLKYNLNDTQVVLALCYASSGLNAALESRPYVEFPITTFDVGNCMLRYVTLRLTPHDRHPYASEASDGRAFRLSHILFGDLTCYHPAQRSILPPLNLRGCSYQESVKQLSVFSEAMSAVTQFQQPANSTAVWPYCFASQQSAVVVSPQYYVSDNSIGAGYQQGRPLLMQEADAIEQEQAVYFAESGQLSQPHASHHAANHEYAERVPLFVPALYNYNAPFGLSLHQAEGGDEACASDSQNQGEQK